MSRCSSCNKDIGPLPSLSPSSENPKAAEERRACSSAVLPGPSTTSSWQRIQESLLDFWLAFAAWDLLSGTRVFD